MNIEGLLGQKIKVVFSDGDRTKAVVGVLREADDRFLYLIADPDASEVIIAKSAVVSIMRR